MSSPSAPHLDTDLAERVLVAFLRDEAKRAGFGRHNVERALDWLADLAVGWAGDQIKVGSITQSERLARYYRLLEIEAESELPVVSWPGRLDD